MRIRNKLRWIERRQNNKHNWGKLPFGFFDIIILVIVLGLAVLVLRAAFIYAVTQSPPNKSLHSFGESSHLGSAFQLCLFISGLLFCFWGLVTIFRINKLKQSLALLVWHLTIFLSIGMLAFGSYSSVNFRPVSKYESVTLTDDIRQAILHIEKDAILPREAFNKNRYERFYAITTSGDMPTLEAVFILANRFSNVQASSTINNKVVIYPHYDAYFVTKDNLPRIYDGGCGVITIYYNLETKTIQETKQVIVDVVTRNTQDVVIHGYCNGNA